MRPSVEVQLTTRRREIERSVRHVDSHVLSAYRWVRQRASHNRRTPQVAIREMTDERSDNDSGDDEQK